MPDFMERVRDGSSAAVSKCKGEAIRHVSEVAGIPGTAAEDIYEYIRGAIDGSLMLVVNAQLGDAESLLKGEGLTSSRSEKTRQIENALGIPSPPVYGLLTAREAGNRSVGPASIIIGGDMSDVALVCGDAGRVRNPSRKDFRENPSDILMSWEHADHCKAAATLLAMGTSELSSSPGEVVAKVNDASKDYGPCHALVTGEISPGRVSMVVVPDHGSLGEVREAMSGAGRLVATSASPMEVRLRAPFWQHEEPDSPRRDPSPSPMFFSPGDEVSCKRSPSNPDAKGVVLAVSGGDVAVEWDGGGRTVFDMTEALARLTPAPRELRGLVSYSLPGMDEDSAVRIAASGGDPVTVHAVASTIVPVAPGGRWDEEGLSEAMGRLGFEGEFVEGFARGGKGVAFSHRRWFEAPLPYGGRLVVDPIPGKPRIVAGAAPDYMRMPSFPGVPLA